VPGFLVGLITAIQSAMSNGFISAAEVGAAIVGFIKENTKYVMLLVGLIVIGLMLKKAYKQITFMLTLWINSDRSRSDVEVKPQ